MFADVLTPTPQPATPLRSPSYVRDYDAKCTATPLHIAAVT